VRVPVHVEELHSLYALLAHDVLPGPVEPQQDLVPLPAGHDEDGLPARRPVGHAVRRDDPELDGRLLPRLLLPPLRVHEERVFVLHRPAQHAEVQDLAGRRLEGRVDPTVDRERVNFRERRLSHEKVVHLHVVRRPVDRPERRVPDHEFSGVGDPVVRQLSLQRPLHVEQAQHAAPHLHGRGAVQVRMVPIHAGRMMLGDGEAIAVTLPRLHPDVGSVGVVRVDRVEHVHLDI